MNNRRDVKSTRDLDVRDHPRFGQKMSPYVNRIRLNVVDFTDPKLSGDLCKAMEAILIGKKICPDEARIAVVQTINIAANFCLEPLRRAENLNQFNRARDRLTSLIGLINSFVEVVSKLPPHSKGKLNAILSQQDLRNFDSEVFANIVHTLDGELSKVSPSVLGDRARSVLKGTSFQDPDNSELAKILRDAPPEILDFWETIPLQTRAQVEADVRSLSRCKSVVQFFRYLVSALRRYYPQLRTGRRAPIERLFAGKVAAIWCRLRLALGRAYFPDNKHEPAAHRPSRFQRFCDLALAAVGEGSRISAR